MGTKLGFFFLRPRFAHGRYENRHFLLEKLSTRWLSVSGARGGNNRCPNITYGNVMIFASINTPGRLGMKRRRTHPLVLYLSGTGEEKKDLSNKFAVLCWESFLDGPKESRQVTKSKKLQLKLERFGPKPCRLKCSEGLRQKMFLSKRWKC